MNLFTEPKLFRPLMTLSAGWFILGLISCISPPKTNLIGMETPEIVRVGADRFFPQSKASDSSREILFATDRQPAKSLRKATLYSAEQSTFVRVGKAQIDHINQTQQDKNNLISLEKLKEIGILKNTNIYGDLAGAEDYSGSEVADKQFSKLINQKLGYSKSKDIIIFINGYRTLFENPLLVAAEFSEYLKDDGVVIAYSWATTPKLFDYMRDVETTRISSSKLRKFLNYLAKNTNAENIHIVAHSAGTRVTMDALQQMALSSPNSNREGFRRKFKIGQVVLAASDANPKHFAAASGDGMLLVPNRTTVYISTKDKALNLSRLLFRTERLGQLSRMGNNSTRVSNWVLNHKYLNFIDVSADKRAFIHNGHSYFRSSPWTSSDLILLLKKNLHPSKRGLERKASQLYWSFPKDYSDRLRSLLLE